MDVRELYDLETDPNELENLYGREEYQSVQEEFHEKLEALKREVGDDASP